MEKLRGRLQNLAGNALDFSSYWFGPSLSCWEQMENNKIH